ncbi:MAG: ABC transporter permease [Candidatus Neomarinimicrobiota bacterium]
MILWIGAITQGLGYAFLALGVYLTFRVLKFADMTVDGSFVTGASVTAILIINGVHPLLAMLAAIVVGSLFGMLTGLIHTKFKVDPLLASILVMTGLYSINLHIMGRSNLPLMNERTVVSIVEGWNFGIPDFWIVLAAFLVVVLILRWMLVVFLKTDLGLALRATGDNPQMISAQGVNTDTTKIFGLALSNGLVAFSGSLIAQYQGFADVGMGIGILVAGIASVIIGESIVGKKSVNLLIWGVIFGSILFRLLIALALKAGLNPIDLKLVTAVFVFLALALPQIRRFFKK